MSQNAASCPGVLAHANHSSALTSQAALKSSTDINGNRRRSLAHAKPCRTQSCTERIPLGPLVLNNDFRHPALLVQELASLDRLSDGRVEVGIGAGHSFPEYAALGVVFDPPDRRKERLVVSVELLRRLLDGETVTHTGVHYQLDGVATLRPCQDHVPILVGVNGKTALAHAARHVDVIGLSMFGRT